MEDKNYIYEINNESNQINSPNDTYTFESKGELITIRYINYKFDIKRHK